MCIKWLKCHCFQSPHKLLQNAENKNFHMKPCILVSCVRKLRFASLWSNREFPYEPGGSDGAALHWNGHLLHGGAVTHSLLGFSAQLYWWLAGVGDAPSYSHSPWLCCIQLYSGGELKRCTASQLFPKDVAAGIILCYLVSPCFLHIALSQSMGPCESCDALLRDGVFLTLC